MPDKTNRARPKSLLYTGTAVIKTSPRVHSWTVFIHTRANCSRRREYCYKKTGCNISFISRCSSIRMRCKTFTPIPSRSYHSSSEEKPCTARWSSPKPESLTSWLVLGLPISISIILSYPTDLTHGVKSYRLCSHVYRTVCFRFIP